LGAGSTRQPPPPGNRPPMLIDDPHRHDRFKVSHLPFTSKTMTL
jgi:hypothetical protein